MNRDRLEEFVNENRHEFDCMEPSDKLWDAISAKLEEQPQQKVRKMHWMRIAVAIAVIVSVPVVWFAVGPSGENQTAATNVDPEVRELIEAEAFYAQEVSGKMAEIEKCYKVYPELKSEIEGDLNELEMMYLSLKSDLNENISNKEVIEAMIENNRNRMKLVEDVLEQINC